MLFRSAAVNAASDKRTKPPAVETPEPEVVDVDIEATASPPVANPPAGIETVLLKRVVTLQAVMEDIQQKIDNKEENDVEGREPWIWQMEITQKNLKATLAAVEDMRTKALAGEKLPRDVLTPMSLAGRSFRVTSVIHQTSFI